MGYGPDRTVARHANRVGDGPPWQAGPRRQFGGAHARPVRLGQAFRLLLVQAISSNNAGAALARAVQSCITVSSGTPSTRR